MADIDASGPATRHALAEVGASFLKLGCTSFGGPIAHLGFFRAEFVERRRWIDDHDFSELVALCSFLPGPTSSQLVFAIGMRRAGLAGALLASLCFAGPSVLLMIAFAYGVLFAKDLGNPGWLHGLKLAAVAVVAQAVWGMGRKLCFDAATFGIAVGAAALALTVTGAAGQIGAIVAGALLGWWRYRGTVKPLAEVTTPVRGRHGWAICALSLFFAGLIILPLLSAGTGDPWIRYGESFYRAGALVFGGGHVVLPLLQAELVPPGLIGESSFLAGYGAAQAVPGPLFSFAAYLGTVMQSGSGAWVAGLLCAAAIFLPGWLLIGGALSFWPLIKGKAWARAGIVGANAAVVGLLAAAFYRPVCTQGITGPGDVVIAASALILLQIFRWPPWLVVAASAAIGQGLR